MNKEYIEFDNRFMQLLKTNSNLKKICADIENIENARIIGNSFLIPASLVTSIASIPMFLHHDASSAIICTSISIASITICGGLNLIANKKLRLLHNQKEENLVLKKTMQIK